MRACVISVMYVLLSFGACVTAAGTVQYDNVRFKHLDGADGLPHNTVYSITQDDYGFMWFATANGLCRYDGYEVTVYSHAEEDSTSLNHDFVSHLYNDSFRQSIWISTDVGICRYDYGKDCFHTYDINGNNDDDITFILTREEHDLLAVCSDGIFRYDSSADTFEPFTGYQGRVFLTAAEDCSSRIWIGTGSGLICYDLRQSRYVDLPATLKNLGKIWIEASVVSGTQLVLCNDNYCYIYDTISGTLYNLSHELGRKTFRCAETDGAGNIWMGTEYGIYVYDSSWKLLAHYDQSEEDISELNDSPVYSIFRDGDDNMWVGTYFGGVNYFVSGSDQFRTWSYGSSHNTLSGKAIRQIENAPDGGLYIATEDGGLNHIGPDGTITRSDVIHRRMAIDAKNVHSLLVDEDGSLWIGLFLKGVLHYMPDRDITVDYSALTEDVSSGFDIIGDMRGNIWYAGPSGLFRIDRNRLNAAPRKISPLRFLDLAVHDDSTLWIGARKGGLYSVNTNTFKVSRLPYLSSDELHVTDIFRDSRDRMWVATDHHGLYELDAEGRLLASYGKELIGSDSVKSIIEDSSGNFWAGTGNGLVCISGTDRSCVRYTSSDGLPADQFNYTSACLRPDGELCFGTIDGMVSFYPEKVRQEKPSFKIVVTGISMDGEYISPEDTESPSAGSVSALNGIVLKHRQSRSFQIDYSGLNYRYSSDTRYAMMMEGVDEDWQAIGNQHQVRFTGLRAGNYLFKVKAGIDGVNWDDAGQLDLAIRVLPPWYASPVAFCMYVLCSVLVLWWSYRWYRARLSLKMRLEAEHDRRLNIEKMNRAKTDFFTYVSHDLKTPLTLILSPLQEMLGSSRLNEDDRSKLSVVYRNANRMNYLIKELLTFSKIEMKQKKILVRQGDIMRFMDETSKIFGMIAREKDIDFVVRLEDTGKKVWFSPSSLERILYNLLSNAFKYTDTGGCVTLGAHFDEKEGNTIAVISVKDTGRGIPQDSLKRIFDSYYQVDRRDHREGFGLGLALTRSLIKIHKGEIDVISEVGKGTEFIVSLNVSDNAFSPDERSSESITGDEIRKYNQRIQDTLELIPERLESKADREEKETVLVVEDSPEMNDYITGIFNHGYRVLRAYDGQEAIDMLSKNMPDIIVSDVMMPKLDGLAMLAKIRDDVKTSHIPVVLLTAKTDENDHTDGYLHGADAYIDKPFNAKNLELLVKNIISGRRRNIEHFRKMGEMNVKEITNNPRDEAFMEKLVGLIMDNIREERFGVAEITAGMNVSRSLLHMKLKSLAGCSITQFIRNIKMKEARTCLANGMNVSETAYAVGMADPNYFTKCFKAEFNITPTEYLKSIRK